MINWTKITVITAITISIITFKTQAQTIPILGLLKFYSLNRDEIENILMMNGYSYHATQKHDKDFKTVHYGHKNKSFFRAIHFKYFNNNQLVEVGYVTSNQQEYINLKNQIKGAGFSFDSSYDLDSEPVNIYKSKKMLYYKIEAIQSYVQQTGNNQYYILLQKEPNYVKAFTDK